MLEGRFFGTMALSEPHAGSSLGDVVTRAVPPDDGTYRIFGSKMWISGGDHEMGDNIVHLVLAKLPDAAARDAGHLAVRRPQAPRRGGRLASASATTSPSPASTTSWAAGARSTPHRSSAAGAFTPGGAAGAVGHLVGEPGTGPVLHVPHDERGAPRGRACPRPPRPTPAYLKSLEYARSRPQGRPARRGQDPSAPQVPIIEHADVRRMLLAQKSYVEGALALDLYCSRLLDDQRPRATRTSAPRPGCCSTC